MITRNSGWDGKSQINVCGTSVSRLHLLGDICLRVHLGMLNEIMGLRAPIYYFSKKAIFYETNERHHPERRRIFPPPGAARFLEIGAVRARRDHWRSGWRNACAALRSGGRLRSSAGYEK